MRKHDFYSLPRSLQDRFIESSQGVSVPKPLLVAVAKDFTSVKWAGGAILALLGWGAFVMAGFGDLSSSLALGGGVHLAIHVVFAAVVSFCALRSFAVSWEGSRRPFGSGAFLFASGVVQSTGAMLVEYDANDVQSVSVEGSELIVVFSKRTFRFTAESKDKAESAQAAFDAGRDAWKQISAGGDSLERARLNALVDSGVPNPLAPTQAHQRPRLFAVAVLVVITIVAALTLGYAVSDWRNSLSEDALYQAAVQKNTVSSYKAYMARGGERAVVRDLFLPRAELAAVKEVGTVEAIVEFDKTHAGSQIAPEIQIALREALLAQLEDAKTKGKLSIIDALPKKYPQHVLITNEIAVARREVFTKALHDFQKQANPKTADLVGFVQYLLAHSEQHGPKVQVRWYQEFPQDPKRLDSIVTKSKKYYLGRVSRPTQYFLGEIPRQREKKIGEEIIARFQKVFPEDVLKFELAPPPKAENEELAAITVPTLTLGHREKLSGGFVGGKPKGMYMGASVLMTGTFQLPNSSSEIDYKWNAWRSPQFSILVQKGKGIPDVYEDMMGGVFASFGEKFLASWFKEP